MSKTSELPGFFRLDMAARRKRVSEVAAISVEELDALSGGKGLADAHAEHMVENAVGVMGLPLGLCVNMRVDGRDHLVPMAVEEASVVAACSYASKLLRAGGGVQSVVSAPHVIGQIQVLGVADASLAEQRLLAARAELVELANATNPVLVSHGGGAIDIEVRHLQPLSPSSGSGPNGASDPVGPMLVVHLIVDVRDAMGANAVNTMCERIAARVAELTQGRVGLRILSNLADRRLVSVEGRVPLALLSGKGTAGELTLARGIEEASVFAERDPYRAATHNKGIMNGIDAALIALGQDWRAIEAGAHAFAARGGRYTALATWRVEGEFLVGRMTLPMAVGSVGGIVNVHPAVRANRKLCGIESAKDMASIVAATGLAQNLAALRALSAEGIQLGHMRLHARNIAIEAGAAAGEIQAVADRIADQQTITLDAARQALASLRAENADAAPPSARTRKSVVPPPSGVASPEDRAFCDAALPGVSRTFALSIQALPAELRDAICVAYLLCRVVDTVEDDRRKAPEVRGALFVSFDRALEQASDGDGSLGAVFAEDARKAGLGVSDSEKALCNGAGAVFRTFASLPESQRRGIEPHVAEMSRGMRVYSERADAEGGLKLRDVEDLEKYCYYVAGTVGELLTELFAQSFPLAEDAQGKLTRKELDARAVSFGLGLQLVNILKDVAEDALRGDCFLPQKQAAQLGLDLANLLVPSERQKGLTLLRALSARARHHLDRAEEYTLLWPASSGEIRMFCSVPLALALATLREIEIGDDALVPNRAPTVSRALVMRAFEDAMDATRAPAADAGDRAEDRDRALKALFDRSRSGVVGRPSRPTCTLPTPERPSGDRPTTSHPEHSDPDEQAPARPSGPASANPKGVASAGVSSDESKSRGNEMSDTRQDTRPKHGLQPRKPLGGKVLVTGGAGHVGANLVHRLLSDDRDVRVFLREGSNNAAVDAIEESLGRKVERVFGDLRSPRDCAIAARGCDHVFHVAARVSTLSEKERDLRDLYACNVLGTANILRAAGDAGVKRTVVTGSFSAVGFDLDDPGKANDETVPFYPFAEHMPYGRTKSLVEHEVLKAVVDGVDAVIATSCAVLGPWDYKPSRMGKTLIDFSTGNLSAYLPGGFDFVNTRDLIDGHVLAMERGRSGQRYILSTEFATVDQLMEIFEEVSGRPRPRLRLPAGVMAGVASVTSFVMSSLFPERPQRFTPGAVRVLRMERKADTTKAQTELGYKPTDIRSAIHEAYAQFAVRGLVPSNPNAAGASSRNVSSAPPASDATPKKKSSEGAAA